VILKPIPLAARQAVCAAIQKHALELRPGLVDCEIYLKRPATTTYTSHLFEFPQNVRPFASPSYLTTFDLPQSHVFALREAEAELAKRAAAAARVVAFALGGVSTLTRISREEWDALAERPLTEGVAAADLVQEKFHLFPGLNWRMPGTKARFLDWIRNLAVASRILIFDTGTEGNGLRQIFKLLRKHLSVGETVARLEVEIVGLVDGNNRDSVDDAYEGRSQNGNAFQLTLEYLKVPCVLSEDFQRLVGYKKLYQLGYLHPLRDLGIVRLVDDNGKLLQITGSDNLADVFRGHMTNAIGAPHRLARQGRELLTMEIERAVVEQVLEQGQQSEEDHLHQAWAIGLVTDAQARFLLADIEARYAEELARYPQHVYSFAEKRVGEQFGSEDDLWVES
jgi:hypothetical protein